MSALVLAFSNPKTTSKRRQPAKPPIVRKVERLAVVMPRGIIFLESVIDNLLAEYDQKTSGGAR